MTLLRPCAAVKLLVKVGAAVRAVGDRRPALQAAHVQRAYIGDVVAGAAAAVGRQRDHRRRGAGVEGDDVCRGGRSVASRVGELGGDRLRSVGAQIPRGHRQAHVAGGNVARSNGVRYIMRQRHPAQQQFTVSPTATDELSATWKVGLVTFVMLSLEEVPKSDQLSPAQVCHPWARSCQLLRSVRLRSALVPLVSVAVAVKLWVPAAKVPVLNVQLPLVSAVDTAQVGARLARAI